MNGIISKMQDFQDLKNLHITYSKALFGGLGLFEIDELNLLD